MADWVHCNKCSLKYIPNIKWYLTECGHIFCEMCLGKMRDSKCLICEKSNNYVQISKDLEINVQQFFIPFDASLKKILEVYNFQMQHRMRLYQTLSQKYAYVKKECISNQNKIKNLLRENNMMKKMILSASQGSRPISNSTPAITSCTSQLDNVSDISTILFTPSIASVNPTPGYAQKIIPLDQKSRRSLESYQPSIYDSSRRINMPQVHRPVSMTMSLKDLQAMGKRT